MTLELYHYWDSFCSFKVRFALAEKGLDWTGHHVDLMTFEHVRPEYLKLNPNGVVPTLVHDGNPVIESSVINEYLDEVFPETPLRPADPLSRARMRVWVKYEDDVLHPAIRPATFNLMIKQKVAGFSDSELENLLAHHPRPERRADFMRAARAPVDHQAIADARALIARAVDRLAAALAEGPWLAGETFSLADIAAAPFVDRLEELFLDGLWEDKPALHDWIARLKARPAYAAALCPEDWRLQPSESAAAQ
jgi:glutathione S-transferase